MLESGDVRYPLRGLVEQPTETVLNLCVRQQDEPKCYSMKYRNDDSYDRDYRVSSRETILQNALQRNIHCRSPVLTVETTNRRPMEHATYGSHHSPPVSELETCCISPDYLSRVQISPVTTATTRNGKPTRPFKAYPKDPLALTAGAPSEISITCSSNEAYAEFRRRMLSQVQSSTAINKNMKRPVQSVSPTSQQPSSSVDSKDNSYWERRRKNNEAAKRSRDARRAKEDEIAIRAAFLEQENLKLKYEIAALRNETSRLRCLLYSS